MLLAGALLLALDRGLATDRDDPPTRGYWLSFGVLLLLALLLPPLINASGLSGVAIPRHLGAIAILYTSLDLHRFRLQLVPVRHQHRRAPVVAAAGTRARQLPHQRQPCGAAAGWRG